MRVLPFIFALILVLTPLAVGAQSSGFFGTGNPIVPEECQCRNQPHPDGGTITTAPDFGCVLQVAQNILNALYYFAILVTVLYIVYVGFQYLAAAFSGNNPGSLSAAKTRIVNVVVGLIVILASWLIVDFVMKTLYDDAEFGPWNRILAGKQVNRCIVANNPDSVIGGTFDIIFGDPGDSSSGPEAGEIPASDGTIPGRICSAAAAYRGTSTRNAPGTNNGNLACAWAVNEVLKDAGIKPMGGLRVRDMESALQGGRGQKIAQNSARCGDLVIVTEKKGSHVGVCMNTGCTEVLSNSSSKASFIWKSGPEFYNSYKSGNFRIYRVAN